MLTFRGAHNLTLEKNGRVKLPSKFIKAFQNLTIDKKQLVLTRGIDKCLVAYPIERWFQIEKQIMIKNYSDEKTRFNIRQQFINATEISWDKQGRINIPSYLLDWANIKKEVFLYGVIDKIEIWEKSLYHEYMTKFNNEDKSLFEDLFNIPLE